MADALCGPANPLQQFRKHTTRDRTLQQDRLVSRPSPAQAFRSPDPNAGILDPEFEAFQAALPVPHLPGHHQQLQHHPPPPALASPGPSWAADFQRMQISPPPIQQNRPAVINNCNTTNNNNNNNNNWAQGFQQHLQHSAPRIPQTSSPAPLAFQQPTRYGLNSFQSAFAPQSGVQPLAPESKGKAPVYEQFDEAAFERAFAQAADDAMLDVDDEQAAREPQESVEAVVEEEQDLERAMKVELDNAMKLEEMDPLSRLEDYSVEQPVEEERPQERDARPDEDALAATAQELLEKVRDNQTDKFRNSHFLALMRRLRDREVKVEGDKMVETATTISSSSSPDATTLNASSATTTTNIPLFDNSEQRPSPLVASAPNGGIVDSRPHDYGTDEDLGRIDPNDGQAVVDLLDQKDGGVGDDIGTFSTLPAQGEAPYYADLRSLHGARSEVTSISQMLYGEEGTLEQPISGRSAP